MKTKHTDDSILDKDRMLFSDQLEETMLDEDETMIARNDTATIEDDFDELSVSDSQNADEMATDFSDDIPRKKHKRSKKKKWIVLGCILGVVLIAGIMLATTANRIINDPGSFFTPSPSQTIAPVDEYNQLMSQADLSLMDGIVNVLLVGCDYAEERETWGGKHAYHADVMIVLAVNFNTGKADMISLPRDTYAKIPGVDGIYKLNASLDCGGGYPKGLPKVCEAASWMLGGIPVDYYVSVTMPVLKDLVDAIGGVDYDVDVSFSMMGRSYQKGMQHMNGQAVLDYCRVRKNVAQSGDQNRINRQKKMLIAIFNKMKTEGIMGHLPDFVKAFDGQLQTNMSLSQIAAMAAFGYKLNSADIGMHSMGGSTTNIFNWNFVLTNQPKRVSLIKEVFGIDVPQYNNYSPNAALRKWGGMMEELYRPNALALIQYVDRLIANGAIPVPGATPTPSLPVPTPTPYTPTPTPQAPTPPPSTPTPTPQSPTPTPPGPTPPPQTTPVLDDPKSSSNVYSASVSPNHVRRATVTSPSNDFTIYNKYLTVKEDLAALDKAAKASGKEYVAALTTLKNDCIALAKMVNHGTLQMEKSWKVEYENEIDVDFR